MPFLWDTPNEYPSSLIGTYVREGSPDRFLFRRGIRLPAALPTPTIRFDASAEELARFDVLDSNAMVPLVSQNVAAHLQQICPNDIQLFQTRVVTPSRDLAGYSLLNAIHALNCVDYERSECVFVPKTDHVMKFKRLTLKPNCLGEHHLARESDLKSYLYVSDSLKDAFDRKNWRGYAFLPPEAVHP